MRVGRCYSIDNYTSQCPLSNAPIMAFPCRFTSRGHGRKIQEIYCELGECALCKVDISRLSCNWALIYSFIGVVLRYWDYEPPWILYIYQSSYREYLIHMPWVCFLHRQCFPSSYRRFLSLGLSSLLRLSLVFFAIIISFRKRGSAPYAMASDLN